MPSFDLTNTLYSSDVTGARLTFDLFMVTMPQAGSTRIVFTTNRDGRAQIYSMDSNGSNLTRLTNNGSNDDHPRWSPNGTKILFQSDRDNPETVSQDIYVMNADGTAQTRLTTDAADDCNAAWSPDGSKIVFQSLRNGVYYQVYVMNADGSGQVNRSTGTSNDVQPNWSPNGSKIAFASERDHAGAPSIYSMNVDGSNQTRLTFSSELVRDEQPVWSPDAAKIAFVSTRDGNKEIYSMSASGSNQVRLTNTLENDDSPYWSADGTKLVFRSERERDAYDPAQQLWTMNADGTSQALISSNEFGDYSPSWSTPTSNQSPVANSGGPYSGVVAQNVPFSGTGSFDPDGTITSYAWNFGDGGTGTGVSPTHAYSSAGTYNTSLTVTDNLGAQTSANTTTTITTAGSEQYLANFNLSALARQPYENESSYWNDILRAAYPNGQSSMLLAVRELGKTLFESSAYVARNRDNHSYVYDLYKTYLMREPDAPGWAFWESVCNSNGRENVRRAFDECSEFAGIVSTLTPSGSPSSTVSSLASARVDPFNQPGNGLASRDAEWSVPLLSLPGRARLDLGLSLSYSSMIWTRSGPYIYFDEDNGWPGPGFRLGFPTIQEKVFDAQAGRNVYLMIAGGSRVSLRQLGTSNVYEAADSSYLQLIDYGSSLLLRTTDGTQLNYQSFNSEWRCTQIKDRNGNYITVNYDWLGHITTIIDTLARTITFNYDGNANLTSITQQWNGPPPPHTWVSFGWETRAIDSSAFSGVLAVGAPNGFQFPGLKQVGFDDGTYCKFLYNSAGQVTRITHYASDSNPLTDSHPRSYTAFEYNNASDDCPRVSATHAWAENWSDINLVPHEVVTHYSVEGNAHTLNVEGDPNSTLYKEFYGAGSAGFQPAWEKGLVVSTEVWSKADPSSSVIKQKWTTTSRTQDNTGVTYQTNPRVTETNVFDANQNHRRTTVTYASFVLPSGASCPLPTDTREYAADATTVLRRSHTEYRMDPIADVEYLNRHIIGLAKEQSLYEVNGASETLASRIGFSYDETGSIQGDDAPVRHDNDTSSGYRANFVIGRANLTSVKRYDVTDSSQFSVSSLKYNTAGAVVTNIDPLGHQNSVSYADSFSDNNNSRNTLAYPTIATDADGFSTTVQYNFDFGARTRVQGPPPQNQPQGLIQTFAYDSAARVERTTTANNGAYVRYLYGPNYVVSLATVNTVADEAYSNTVFDGLGRTTGVASNHPGSSGGYKAQVTQYDLLGRAIKSSNPTEIDGNWNPAGDDATGWLYTQQTYDWKGRPLITTNPDTTTKEASYGGCGCAGGEVVTLTDEGTIDAGVAKRRQQKIYSDVLGRSVRTELLNWQGGSVYSTTVNAYNARDQLKLVRQYQGDEASGIFQDTTMTYDGYGRLKTKHLPEQDEGANTAWDYNADDTVQSITDARGVAQTFSYNNRHLVTGIAYAALSGITPTPNVGFGYDAAGNRTSMIDGLGAVTYAYDQLSRTTSESRLFNGLGTYTINYPSYNLANQLTSITDPFGAQVGYTRDVVGHVNEVTGSGFGNISSYASDIQYRAWGALKHLRYGNTRSLDTSYNSRLQMMHYQVGPLASYPTGFKVISLDYQYNADGRLSFADDQVSQYFDRSYSYNHVGELTQALSGAEARGEPATNDRPYKQDFDFDVWGNMTSRTGKHWSQNTTPFSGSYANNRMNGWQYDADGRNTVSNSVTSMFDAAGRLIQTVSPQRRNNPALTLTQAFDGDGRRVKKTEYGSATYLLRSTVLGGVVISEIYGTPGQANFGQKQKGHVYASGTELAEQNTFLNVAIYQHHEPSKAEQGYSYTHPDGSDIRGATQLDPLGDEVGHTDPYLDQGGGGDPLFVYPRFGDIADNPFGCTVDGEPWPCTFAFKYAAVRSSIIEVTPGPGAGIVSPRYLWVLNPSESGGDACKDGVCPQGGVTVYDPGGHFEIAGYDIISNAVPMRSLGPLIPALLAADRSKAINNAFDALKKALAAGINEKCRQNVIDKLTAAFKDFSVDKFNSYLAKGAGFFAGTESQTAIAGTITTVQAARLLFPGATSIADAFRLSPGLNAATSILSPSFKTFFRPEAINLTNNGINGRNQSLLFHEALHGYGGSLGGISYFDSELQQAFGIKVQADSSNISKYIKDNCF